MFRKSFSKDSEKKRQYERCSKGEIVGREEPEGGRRKDIRRRATFPQPRVSRYTHTQRPHEHIPDSQHVAEDLRAVPFFRIPCANLKIIPWKKQTSDDVRDSALVAQ